MFHKLCKRCKSDFECNAANISRCSCASIRLRDDTKRYLAKTKYDCLCTPCLRELNELHQKIAAEVPGAELQNERDYYIENGLMVFTEYYHIKKGYCCKSNCRHCAY